MCGALIELSAGPRAPEAESFGPRIGWLMPRQCWKGRASRQNYSIFPPWTGPRATWRPWSRLNLPISSFLDSTTPSIYSDIECAAICKKNSSAKVIMVGPHVSALPAETLQMAHGAVDVACIGEYDYTVLDVAQNFNDLSQTPGIGYLEDGKPVLNSRRPLIEDLDSLPFPAWRHLDLMKYFDGSKLYPYIDIFSGRGCPHGCSFCLWPQVMHGRKIRLRSPERVVDEMEYDIGLCPQVTRGGEFFFEDDTFTAVKSNAIAICEEVLSRGLKITFSVNARVDTADPELFRFMKAAGCRELLVGFESGDKKILDGVNKKQGPENAVRFMELARSAKLDVHGCFVFGLPGETEETIESTIKFALKLGLHTVSFQRLCRSRARDTTMSVVRRV